VPAEVMAYAAYRALVNVREGRLDLLERLSRT
jgi:hypothetical protein